MLLSEQKPARLITVTVSPKVSAAFALQYKLIDVYLSGVERLGKTLFAIILQ